MSADIDNMTPGVKQPSSDVLLKTINACINNGDRLLQESNDLEFRKPPASQFFLIMIAQEELAKAFILILIEKSIVPFSRAVLRAINDHACKQLVGMIMDYIIMHWDDIEELKAAISRDCDLGSRMPEDVGSAMELLRYEKIGRWERNNWVWAENPGYDKSALHIAEGRKDRHKQDALYVRIGRDGQVCSTPLAITESETRSELERADRYRRFVVSVLNGEDRSHRYEKAIDALKSLFADLGSRRHSG